MNRPELFERTVNTLVAAQEQGTLQHADPCGCAVGNIVAASCGYSIQKDYGEVYWCIPDTQDRVEPEWFLRVLVKYGEHNNQTKATGYSLSELHMIEKVFEDRDERGFSNYHATTKERLSYVYDSLCTIHEVSSGDLIGDNPFEEATIEESEAIEA